MIICYTDQPGHRELFEADHHYRVWIFITDVHLYISRWLHYFDSWPYNNRAGFFAGPQFWSFKSQAFSPFQYEGLRLARKVRVQARAEEEPKPKRFWTLKRFVILLGIVYKRGHGGGGQYCVTTLVLKSATMGDEVLTPCRHLWTTNIPLYTTICFL